MQVIPVIFFATNEQKFLVCEQAFSAKSEMNIIVHCSPPSLTPFPRKKCWVRACFAILCLLLGRQWLPWSKIYNHFLEFFGIFTVFRSPRWFSPFKKLVWYTNRSVISTPNLQVFTKLTCVCTHACVMRINNSRNGISTSTRQDKSFHFLVHRLAPDA